MHKMPKILKEFDNIPVIMIEYIKLFYIADETQLSLHSGVSAARKRETARGKQEGG